MKGDMEVEVLDEPGDGGRAGRRAKHMMMSMEEQKLYCHSPNRARNANLAPGYPDEDYSENV